MYYGLEPNAWSLRSYRGTVILSGGAHRTGRNGGGHYAALREAAQALFPGSREAAHWSAQDCMTASGVPYRAVLRKGPAVVCGDGLPQMGHVECHGRGGAAVSP